VRDVIALLACGWYCLDKRFCDAVPFGSQPHTSGTCLFRISYEYEQPHTALTVDRHASCARGIIFRGESLRGNVALPNFRPSIGLATDYAERRLTTFSSKEDSINTLQSLSVCYK
jgi:hypothetical protein